jgi:hypothetical protein
MPIRVRELMRVRVRGDHAHISQYAHVDQQPSLYL